MFVDIILIVLLLFIVAGFCATRRAPFNSEDQFDTNQATRTVVLYHPADDILVPGVVAAFIRSLPTSLSQVYLFLTSSRFLVQLEENGIPRTGINVRYLMQRTKFIMELKHRMKTNPAAKFHVFTTDAVCWRSLTRCEELPPSPFLRFYHLLPRNTVLPDNTNWIPLQGLT